MAKEAVGFDHVGDAAAPVEAFLADEHFGVFLFRQFFGFED